MREGVTYQLSMLMVTGPAVRFRPTPADFRVAIVTITLESFWKASAALILLAAGNLASVLATRGSLFLANAIQDGGHNSQDRDSHHAYLYTLIDVKQLLIAYITKSVDVVSIIPAKCIGGVTILLYSFTRRTPAGCSHEITKDNRGLRDFEQVLNG